jgi:hypothetical protein
MLGVTRRSGIALACALLVASVVTSSAYASSSFGIERYTLSATEENGSADTQAGSHPYELTAEAVLEPNAHSTSADEVKNLDFELPPGLIINPAAAVPQNNPVGMVQVSVAGKIASATIYNLAPAPGEFARLGFTLEGVSVIADVSVRTGGDYGMTLSIQDLPRVEGEIESVKLTLGGPSIGPFLTLPTSCAGSLQTTVQGESWGGGTASLTASFPQLAGCNRLPFQSTLSVVSDITEADEPSGYQMQLNVPQNESPDGLSAAQLRDASVMLPAGTSLSLSATDGLTGCEEAQVALDSSEPAACANSSKVGLVKIATPLLAHPLEGAVFLATPNANPLGALVALYVVAEEPVSGVLVKLAGQIDLNPVTGQPTLTFDELPQMPIGDIELELFGGPRALLANPPTCGLATSTSELTPWSGTAGVTASSAFELNSGVEGTPCSASQPFSPVFETQTTAAGETNTYGSLSLFVSRADREQQLGAIAIQAPPAVAQMFAGVPSCEEPQASEGACPTASEVGTVTAQAGLDYDPADLSGTVYLTGPYDGAAQGLEIVLPVDPGPFELGTVVMRASAQIEPGTGRLSIASGPLPTFADGVPLQFKALVVQLDREFRVSPDGCEPPTVTGTITGAQGAVVTTATEPFGAASSPCPPQAIIPPAVITGAGGVTGSVSLAGTRIAASRGGRGAVELRCTGTGKCSGKLTLTVRMQVMFEKRGRSGKGGQKRSKTTTIGTASFSISPGKTTTIDVKLNAAGRALLSAEHGRLNATLTILKSSPTPTQTHTEKVQLMQQKAHGNAKK